MLASILGALSSLAAVYLTVMARISGGGSGLTCVGVPGSDCTAPLASDGAWLAGVPLGAWAVALFMWVGVWALRWPAASRRLWERYALLVVASLGCAVAVYKTVFSIVILGAVCAVCLTMAGALAWVLAESWILVRKAVGLEPIARLSSAGVCLSVVVLGVNFPAFSWLSSKALSLGGGHLDSLVAAHFVDPKHELPALGGTPARGGPDAPVVIVEFLDFDCGYCRVAAELLRTLEKDYGKHVRFHRVITPAKNSGGHPPSEPSPSALAAAATIGWPGAWDFQDGLFSVGTLEEVLSLAESKGWSRAKLESAIESDTAERVLAAHERIAERTGVDLVPTVLVNGRVLRHWMRKDVLVAVVEAELFEAGARPFVESTP